MTRWKLRSVQFHYALRRTNLLIRIHSAIGRSTNLIGNDSNIIVIRGGNAKGRPVDEQMAHAMRKFFSDSRIVTEAAPRLSSTSSRDDERSDIPLQRVDSGFSSIVGTENGDRPGGFVLVLDGAALLQVGSHTSANVALVLIITGLCNGRKSKSTASACNFVRRRDMLPRISTAEGTHRSTCQGWFTSDDFGYW